MSFAPRFRSRTKRVCQDAIEVECPIPKSYKNMPCEKCGRKKIPFEILFGADGLQFNRRWKALVQDYGGYLQVQSSKLDYARFMDLMYTPSE